MANNKLIWDLEMRQMLEVMLREGFKVTRIAEELGVSKQSLYSEIRRGITEEEYNNQQYSKYTADKSIDNQLESFKKSLIYGKGKVMIHE